MKVSVIGAGFIGINLINAFMKLGYDITVLDRGLVPVELESSNVNWIQGNVEELSKVEDAVNNADVVFYLVSSTVPGDKVDLSLELFTSLSQLLNTLKICDSSKVEKFVFFSSSSVYGYQNNFPISENSLPNPISSHGIQKLTLEYYLRLFSKNSDIDCKVIRLSNPYGPGQNIYGRQGFISIVIGKITNNEYVLIRGDGLDTRDYIYIDDVVDFCCKLILSKNKELIFNVGSGIKTTLLDIISEFELILGKTVDLKYESSRPADIPISVLDIDRAESYLNFQCSTSLNMGLKKFLSFHDIVTK